MVGFAACGGLGYVCFKPPKRCDQTLARKRRTKAAGSAAAVVVDHDYRGGWVFPDVVCAGVVWIVWVLPNQLEGDTCRGGGIGSVDLQSAVGVEPVDKLWYRNRGMNVAEQTVNCSARILVRGIHRHVLGVKNHAGIE